MALLYHCFLACDLFANGIVLLFWACKLFAVGFGLLFTVRGFLVVLVFEVFFFQVFFGAELSSVSENFVFRYFNTLTFNV